MKCFDKAGEHVDAVPDRWLGWAIQTVSALANAGEVERAQTLHRELMDDPRLDKTSFAQMRLPIMEADLLNAQGRSADAFRQLKKHRAREQISQSQQQRNINVEFRTLLNDEARQLVENNQLKDGLLVRQRIINVFMLLIAIGTISISLLLTRHRKQVAEFAYTDPLTGLLNRRGFFEKLESKLKENGPASKPFALGVIDLDRFKHINDVHGHKAGDELLQTLAQRLKEFFDNNAVVGRLGGDEFAVILDDIDHSRKAEIIGASICATLNQAVTLCRSEILPSGSMGIAIYPAAGTTSGELYDCADFALYDCKKNAIGNAKVFEQSIKSALERQRSIEAAFSSAEEAEFYMEYQPILDLASYRTVGFEALVRWNSPMLGIVPPDEFIPVAERMAKINRLSLMILRKALNDAKSWPDDLTVSINLSSKDLASIEIAHSIEQIILRSGFPPNRLLIELTETAIIEDHSATRDVLHLFKSLGIRLALDDFGTGYSSLLHLKNFPIDRVKIDRSLTQEILSDADSAGIVQPSIEMCHKLGIESVVEGVENSKQLKELQSMKAQYIQGYIIARPMKKSLINDFIARETSKTIVDYSLISAQKMPSAS